ncbi:MAG TPA: 3-hydroxyacyl-ACP dehydratase FabZ [Candidatus Limnocylindrales bacterium]|jgi:3-hydroxyacyl-[acyl-carrier-protein] dehydratase|nr:3-hydroxyacyl-ACP dehydratase FabZ [Candidatus Limnocylindrales bacterium]
MLDIKEIQQILPHRYPFLLVDKIVTLEENKIVGIKNVTINEPFFQGHFPGTPIMPGVLVIEAMAQVGAVLFLRMNEHKNKLAYFTGIDKAKFRKPVVPGDQLRMELEVLKVSSRICKMRGKAFVDETLVVEAELLSALVDKK